MRSISLVLTLLTLAGGVRAEPFPVAKQSAAEPSELVPRGWALEASVDGDLDGDGQDDRVLVLLQDESDDDRARALIVLLHRAEGYTVAGSNAGLLSCFQCLGVKGGDGLPGLEIKRRVLVVSQMGGSRFGYSSVHRFRWNTVARRLELIGLDTSSFDGMTGESKDQSTNFITGRRVDTMTPAQLDDDGNELKVRVKTSKSRVKKLPLLELADVKSEFGG